MFGGRAESKQAGGDDDLYEGFGDYDQYNYAIDATQSGGTSAAPYSYGGGPGGGATAAGGPAGAGAQAAPGTAFRAPGTMSRAAVGSRMGAVGSRMGTAAGGGAGGRPMTSVSSAGFSSQAKKPGFDPLGQASKGPAPPLARKADNSPEDQAKEMEREVNRLMEESAELAVAGRLSEALERSKEAGRRERALCKHREANASVDAINLDLTFAVCFQLANLYHKNDMVDEALNTYSLIVRNKQYPQSGRLRVNMGNIYYEQGKFTNAIKMFSMALDVIPNTGREVRFKIMSNIGNAYVRMGQFQEAIQRYEAIMEGGGDFQTGFNLLICYYALGDSEKMRRGFTQLLSIPIDGMTDEDEEEESEGKQAADGEGKEDGTDPALARPDGLKLELKARQKKARHFLLTAAKMVAPVIDRRNWTEGYDWVIDSLKHAQLDKIAGEMKLCKALHFLREKQFERAIEVLKSFERQDNTLLTMASTNLSFLYFLEGDIQNADKYAELAVRGDRYNAKALVNKGNCMFVQDNLERAKELYLEAIGVEADCCEAIYNLGLVNMRLNELPEALQCYEKLHSIVPSQPETLFQIAALHEQMLNFRQACKWLNILIGIVPSDPGALARLGSVFNKDEDEEQAHHYHSESYRYYPVNLDVISWLGVWYVKIELYEKAIGFFERASQIQPSEVKWKLMVTSCYRRMGSFETALGLYENIHAEFPENLECLRYLVALCKDLGRRYDHHQQELSRLERQVAATSVGKGALTRMGVGPQQDAAPQAARGGGGGGGRGLPQVQEAGDESGPSGPTAVPDAELKRGGGGSRGGAANNDEFDFADADVGDLLTD